MKIVHILPADEAGLEVIADYIAQDNPHRAVSFVCELYDQYASLAATPLVFPLVPRYEHQEVRHRVHDK